jgi:hypothetical protein
VNLLTFASFFFAACQAPVDASSPEQGKTEVRVYDLSSLAEGSSTAQISDTVWPVVNPHGEETGWELGFDVDEEAPANLLRSLFAREFEVVGNSIEYQGAGRFMIQGPTSLHERITKVLPQIASVLGARVELEVDFVRLAQVGSPGPGLFPEAQANALISAAESESRLARQRFSLSSARPEAFVQGRWVNLVIDYDVEVAQGANVFDPQPVQARLGTTIALRAAPGSGGIFLALTLRRATGLGDVIERRLVRTSRVGNERESRIEEAEVLHQRLQILDQGLSLNTFLPEGQALAIPMSHARAKTQEVLIVRRVGGGLQRTARLEPGAGQSLLLLDSSAWAPPYAASSWGDGDFGWVFDAGEAYVGSGRVSVNLLGPRERGVDILERLYNRPESSDPLGSIEEFWPWIALGPEGEEPLPDVEAELAPLAPDQRLVHVALTLRSPESKAPLASVTLPLRVGESSSALLGIEDSYVGDVSVEVAQYANVEDPQLNWLFDGLMLELEPRLSVDQTLTLRLRGLAMTPEGEPRKVELSSGTIGEMETAAKRLLMITQTLRFAAGDKGPRTIGDLAGGLMLEVEVRN